MKPQPIGSIIDGIFTLREAKRALEADIKEVEEKIATQETMLLERMEKEGVIKSTGKLASASVSEVVSFQIGDFDTFWNYARKNNMGHLFQRRVSDLACRELYDKKGGAIPGLESFKKRRANIRTLASK
jgi:hypothetical protein